MNKKTSTWGYVRFGNRPHRSALPWALATGTLISVLFASIAAAWGTHSTWWINFIAFFAGVLPFAIAAAWIALVDRTTITGAFAKPEQSVEHTWLMNAAATSFFLTLGATGAASAVFTMLHNPIGTTLMVVSTAMMVLLTASYLLFKRKA